MPRAKQQKLYRNFTKGLITEASFLTYPEDASIGELNTVISRKGNRTRRQGVDYEAGHALVEVGNNASRATTEFVWRAADNKADRNFLVLQIGSKLHFFRLVDSQSVSNSKHAYTLDLATFKITSANLVSVDQTPCSYANGKGFLFVVHPFTEPVIVEYANETDTFTAQPIIIQVRDLEGLNDNLANDAEPTSLSPEHHYNLRNQGWGGPGDPSTAVRPTGGGSADITQPPRYYDPYTGREREYNQFENIP